MPVVVTRQRWEVFVVVFYSLSVVMTDMLSVRIPPITVFRRSVVVSVSPVPGIATVTFLPLLSVFLRSVIVLVSGVCILISIRSSITSKDSVRLSPACVISYFVRSVCIALVRVIVLVVSVLSSMLLSCVSESVFGFMEGEFLHVLVAQFDCSPSFGHNLGILLQTRLFGLMEILLKCVQSGIIEDSVERLCVARHLLFNVSNSVLVK